LALDDDEIQDIINRSGLDEEFIVNRQRAYNGRIVSGKNGGIVDGNRINKFIDFAKVYITPGEELAINDDEIQDIINRSGLDEEFIVNQQRAYNGRIVGGKNGGIMEGKSINTFLNFAKVYITPGEELALDDNEIQDIINRSGLDEEFIVNQQRAYNGHVVGGIESGKRNNNLFDFAKVYITPGEEMALDDDEIQDVINMSGLDEEFIVTQQRAYNGRVVGNKNGCKSEDDWRLLLEKCKKHYEVHGIWPG
jgi:hypothetical protein